MSGFEGFVSYDPLFDDALNKGSNPCVIVGFQIFRYLGTAEKMGVAAQTAVSVFS